MSITHYCDGHHLGKLSEWTSLNQLVRETKKSAYSYEQLENALSPFFNSIQQHPGTEKAFYKTLEKTLSQRSLAPISQEISKEIIEGYVTSYPPFKPILASVLCPAVLEEINSIFLYNLGLCLERGEHEESKTLYTNLARRHQAGLGPFENLNKAAVEEYLRAGPLLSTHLAIEGREIHPHFHYLKGSAAEKSTDENAHAIMTLNACMMDKDLPQSYGGMPRAKHRIEKLTDLIQEHNPDVFLSQEVTLKNGYRLFERIRESYAHIWAGIGAAPGSQLSALFVASKYPLLDQPRYFPFPKDMQRFGTTKDLERGFICLETPGYWVVTTHMEAGSPKDSHDYRRRQLRFITEKMDEMAAETKKPYIVTGDLNIERTTKEADEYSQSGIAEDYYDFYTEQHPSFDEGTMTCTNLFTARANGRAEPEEDEERNEIDDYVLSRKGCENRFEDFDVELVTSTFDLDNPWDEATTDHRGYIAKFALKAL